MHLRTVIPSHKRADKVYAKRLLTDPIICVAESQAEAYARCNPECEIVTHPDDLIGLVPKRNWIARHFGDVFMLDDDVVSMKRLYAESGEPQTIRDPQEVTRLITELYEIACLLDLHLFGYTSRTTPVMYEENEYLCLRKMITGCSYGVRHNRNVWWNEELRLKEDFWISCYVKYKERRILTDLRYSFNQKDTFVNEGGLSAIRNQEEERRAILFIKKSFGDAIRLKNKTQNGKDTTIQKIEHNISVRFPF